MIQLTQADGRVLCFSGKRPIETLTVICVGDTTYQVQEEPQEIRNLIQSHARRKAELEVRECVECGGEDAVDRVLLAHSITEGLTTDQLEALAEIGGVRELWEALTDQRKAGELIDMLGPLKKHRRPLDEAMFHGSMARLGQQEPPADN